MSQDCSVKPGVKASLPERVSSPPAEGIAKHSPKVSQSFHALLWRNKRIPRRFSSRRHRCRMSANSFASSRQGQCRTFEWFWRLPVPHRSVACTRNWGTSSSSQSLQQTESEDFIKLSSFVLLTESYDVYSEAVATFCWRFKALFRNAKTKLTIS